MPSAGPRLESFWTATAKPSFFEKLSSNEFAEVTVIGGGLTGILTAYLLSKEGKQVALLNDGPLGNGDSGRTTAHITWALDGGYAEITKMHGAKKARMAFESHRDAIALIESIVRDEKIECGFRRIDGYLFKHPKDTTQTLDNELKALTRLRIPGVERISRAPLGFDTGPAIRYSDQAQFHPIQFIQGVADAVVKRGGRIFTDAHVSKIGKHYVAAASGRKVAASHIVVATHTPIESTFVFLKQTAFRTYAVGFPVESAGVTPGLYWDTGNPDDPHRSYHYIRFHPAGSGQEMLIVGGSDHKTGQSDDYEMPFLEIENWTREHFPQAAEPAYRWSGQVLEPIDDLGFIGRKPYYRGNHVIATGYSGNGMTYAAIAAHLSAELISTGKSRWKTLYDLKRKSVRSAPEFLTEGADFVKHFAGDRLKKADEPSAESLANGEGAVLKAGYSTVAAYRDERGDLHCHSAVCPHMHCIVQWNAAEKSFDCPCHGSRFGAEGKVIQGPASKDLDEISPRVIS